MSLEIDDGARAVVDAATPALEALGISKQFGSVRALEDVSLKLRRGSVHALLGENGAGKSTLVKCIMGYYSADVGQVLVNGVAAHIKSPRDAAALGVGMGVEPAPGAVHRAGGLLERGGERLSAADHPLAEGRVARVL